MADPRSLLKESWTRFSTEEREELESLGMELWRQTLAATKGQVVTGVYECRGCHKQNKVEVPVEVPDILTRAKAFAVLADQGYGKPEETRVVTVDVGERTLEQLRALPMSELAALAGVSDAEWSPVELPPAA